MLKAEGDTYVGEVGVLSKISADRWPQWHKAHVSHRAREREMIHLLLNKEVFVV